MGFPYKPTLEFDSKNVYPTVSMWTITMVLLTKYHMNYNAFKNAMFMGLKLHGGFEAT